jgi:hypothetical protein
MSRRTAQLRTEREHTGSGVSIVTAIAPLARQIAGLQDQMRQLGMFANDRELLRCKSCGLIEDVTSTGFLITCRNPELSQDTGRRFEPLAAGRFPCPACSQIVLKPTDQPG